MSATDLETGIAANVRAVRARVEQAASAAGRDPATVRLVAVSKTFGPEAVRAAAAAGLRDFGENKVQEGEGKVAALADLGLTWHLIGHLQSNKVRRAARSFAWIHTVDRPELLVQLDRAAGEFGTRLDLLVQVDLAGEVTKHGASSEKIRGLLDAGRALANVSVVGLMLLPPYFEDPEAARLYFRRLAGLRQELLQAGVPPAQLRELSMGMSHDFEVAVQEGATMVRIGTAIFGPRPAAPSPA